MKHSKLISQHHLSATVLWLLGLPLLLAAVLVSSSHAADCPNVSRHSFPGLQYGKTHHYCQSKGKTLQVASTASNPSDLVRFGKCARGVESVPPTNDQHLLESVHKLLDARKSLVRKT